MSSASADPAASRPSPREEEGSARKRIAYSREFLVSAGTSCTRLPVGFDASKLSELSQVVETGSRAPLGRWRDACLSPGSGNTESKSNQLDRHNWQSKEYDGLLGRGAFPRIPYYAGSLASDEEHDGLLGSGAFPRIPYYTGSSASDAQGRGCQLTRWNTGGYQPTRQYKAPPVSQKNVDLINADTSGSFENWSKDRMEEARKRRASFELIRREQRRALHEKKKAPDSDKENHGAGIISLLHDSAGKGDPQTRSDKQGGLNVSSLSKEDAIKTVPLLPTPTTSPLKPLGFANGLPQKTLQIQSFNISQNSEIQQFNTEDIMESSICAQRFSGGRILGSVHADTLSPKQITPFRHSKFGPFHMRPGTVVECDYPTFSGSSKEGLEIHLPEEDTLFSVKDFSYTQNIDHGSAAEGANFDEEGSEICLPEEDALFLVNDFLCTQNTDQWSAAEWDRAEGLPPKDEAADMNSRFQSLDVSGSHSHDHIDRNNLYHLSKNKPNAELPKRNACTMLLPSDRNRQAPFEMPKATHNGAYFRSPQDMKSMQGVRPAPGGPCAGPAAAHHILLHMTMPGSFLPPQAFPICAPHMFYDRTHMTGANSFHVRRCQPGYGETGIMMTGPPAPGLEGYHAGAFDRPVQAERRGRSMQVHPELAGDVHGFHRHFRR